MNDTQPATHAPAKTDERGVAGGDSGQHWHIVPAVHAYEDARARSAMML